MPAWFSLERVLGLVLVATLWLPVAWIGPALHLGIRFTLAIFAGSQFGEWGLASVPSGFWRRFLGLTIWAGALSIILTALYYLNVNQHSFTHLLVESGLGIFSLFLSFFIKPPEEESKTPPRPWSIHLITTGATLIALCACAALIFLTTQHATHESVRTPWSLFPNGVFLLFVLPFVASLLTAWKQAPRWQRVLSNAAAWFSVSSLTTFLYPLGYGFDGFIHRASEQVLQTTGTLHPKPLYYLGQYVWTTWISSTFELPLRLVDIWLVPVAIIFPLLALLIWQERESTRQRWLIPFTILLLPLGAFVTTTPQSFAYILAFGGLIAALWERKDHRSWILPLVWALWATVTHPLGGLPVLIFVTGAWLASFATKTHKRTIFLGLGSFGALAAIPFAFWGQSWLGGAPISWSWDALQSLTWHDVLPALLFEPRQTLTLWVDAAEWVRLAWYGILIGLGLWQIARPQKPFYRWLAFIGLGFLLVQWTLEHVATFGFLISYERNNYTERLAILSAFFLVPGAASWISERVSALRSRSGLLFAGILLALSFAWPLRIYDAFPRQDAAQSSSGWSVGEGDLAAVHWIQEQAAGKPYAVLANQSVSAVALETYGFARYTNDVFYYPIPTGGPLYQLFLKVASTNGTMADIQQAASLTQSDSVFVVMNTYWWNADLVNERLAETASQSISFHEGAVWVYRFDVTKK